MLHISLHIRLPSLNVFFQSKYFVNYKNKMKVYLGIQKTENFLVN